MRYFEFTRITARRESHFADDPNDNRDSLPLLYAELERCEAAAEYWHLRAQCKRRRQRLDKLADDLAR